MYAYVCLDEWMCDICVYYSYACFQFDLSLFLIVFLISVTVLVSKSHTHTCKSKSSLSLSFGNAGRSSSDFPPFPFFLPSVLFKILHWEATLQINDTCSTLSLTFGKQPVMKTHSHYSCCFYNLSQSANSAGCSSETRDWRAPRSTFILTSEERT